MSHVSKFANYRHVVCSKQSQVATKPQKHIFFFSHTFTLSFLSFPKHYNHLGISRAVIQYDIAKGIGKNIKGLSLN